MPKYSLGKLDPMLTTDTLAEMKEQLERKFEDSVPAVVVEIDGDKRYGVYVTVTLRPQ